MDPPGQRPKNVANPYCGSVGKNGSGGGAASLPRPYLPPPLDHGAKKSQKTAIGYRGAIVYINKWLALKDFPQFCDLTDEHVQEDHLSNFLDNIYHWFATTSFPNPTGYMANTSKDTKFSQIKQVFKNSFPTHSLWKNEEYWKETKKWYEMKCKNSRMNDPEVVEIRKSVPLYRDLSGRNTSVRAKFMCEGSFKTVVDAKTVASSFIEKGNKKNCHILAEFNLTRHAIGRGGEHLLLRWAEANYDEHFEAPDFDWPIVKQNETQCMLIFCDRQLYQLCTFFGFAVYFLFDGLRRTGVSDAAKGYVFPGLHNIRKDGVAGRLTRNIQSILKPIFGDEVAKQTTSRSTRKGAMTENRDNQDLTTQEEYARSGHTASDMNPNAEGYIESTPAMNAPAGRALAGYHDQHAHCTPISFGCLDDRVTPAVDRLLLKLFTNDVPQLQKDKSLYIVVLTCGARLVGAYNDLVKDVTEPD